ncbi:MAG: hypothetical protein M0P00_10500, partial [Bacteroidaceae bacterium]|nr:hypothetical protein [Bacteroidaceae bacterium]
MKISESGKKLLALFLSFACFMPFAITRLFNTSVSAAEPLSSSVVSKVVNGNNGKYVEYLGKPYLMYAIQMRVDWAIQDKGRLSKDEAVANGFEADIVENPSKYGAEVEARYYEIVNSLKDEFIDEYFRRAKEDGYTSVIIPVSWNSIESDEGNYNFSLLEYYYNFLEKYDLKVQWIWGGTDSCGSGVAAPNYMLTDTATYTRKLTGNSTIDNDNGNSNEVGVYWDFSCEATKERERLALGKFMDWLAENDTNKRCVMIQINNEVDQSAGVFEAAAEGGNATSPYWWNNPDEHDKYCWVGGQRAALFKHLSDLGNVVHNSGYNCVTRVNFSGAGRQMEEIKDDITDLIGTTGELKGISGIDIVGEDIYTQRWDPNSSSDFENMDSLFTPADGNVNHLAECSATYNYANMAGKMFSLGAGFMPYCYRDDRIQNGGEGVYVNAQGVAPSDTSSEEYKQWLSDSYWNKRVYRGWDERESTQSLRDFNKIVNGMGDSLAQAVADRAVLQFNGEMDYVMVDGALNKRTLSGNQYVYNKVDSFTETKTIDKLNVKYTADNAGLGMVTSSNNNEYLLTATEGATFEITGDDIGGFDFEAGRYVDNVWTADAAQPTVVNGVITLTAGQIVRVIIGRPYYTLFGNKIPFTLADANASEGLKLSSEVLADGTQVLENIGAGPYTLQLTDNATPVKNFK